MYLCKSGQRGPILSLLHLGMFSPVGSTHTTLRIANMVSEIKMGISPLSLPNLTYLRHAVVQLGWTFHIHRDCRQKS